MTKLYYTPTSCGAASFIAAVAAGLVIDVEQVDLKTHKTAAGEDYYAINAKGNVPALVTNDGIVLNEGAAVLQYIADQVRYDSLKCPCISFNLPAALFFIMYRLLRRSHLRTVPRTDTWL